MNLLLALGGTGAALASLILLISNVAGPCVAILNLLYCVAFIPLSIVGAYGVKGLLPKK